MQSIISKIPFWLGLLPVNRSEGKVVDFLALLTRFHIFVAHDQNGQLVGTSNVKPPVSLAISGAVRVGGPAPIYNFNNR